MTKRPEDREVNVPIERGSEMEAFYIEESRSHRMSLRGWFGFLLQERFRVQIGEIPYSSFWQGAPSTEETPVPRPQKRKQTKEVTRQDFKVDPSAAFEAFPLDDEDL